ncbi:MAG TPA: type II toxin-antitoxin system RelE/ParE family toxin [Chloroflexota bacterium]|nr:type II toxin-antitoxin system RelE/ParE family toxin [Chloroflexota bacterium]
MKLRWAPAASDDLTAAYTYIANDDPERAERVVRTIVNAAEGLVLFPLHGRAGAMPGTRERILSRHPYKIVYRIQGDWIEIVRIVHMAQDWP